MSNYFKRFFKLHLGLFISAVGIVVAMKANIGYIPWEILHAGISKTTGITIGTANIIVGIVIVSIVVLLKEKMGLGSLFNMVLIGFYVDLILATNIIPQADSLIIGILVLFLGLFIHYFGAYFYIDSGFGAGPRDSLMILVSRETKFPIGVCRSAIELAAVAVGWFLGGPIGIGTIISGFGAGLCIQIVFKLVKFDPKAINHETLDKTFKKLFYRKG